MVRKAGGILLVLLLYIWSFMMTCLGDEFYVEGFEHKNYGSWHSSAL